MRGRLKTAIVGPGHWGRNVARELNAVSDLVAYSGTGPAKNAEWARQHIPQARYLTIDEICANAEIAAVAVATPVPLLAPVARPSTRASMCLPKSRWRSRPRRHHGSPTRRRPAA